MSTQFIFYFVLFFKQSEAGELKSFFFSLRNQLRSTTDGDKTVLPRGIEKLLIFYGNILNGKIIGAHFEKGKEKKKKKKEEKKEEKLWKMKSFWKTATCGEFWRKFIWIEKPIDNV